MRVSSAAFICSRTGTDHISVLYWSSVHTHTHSVILLLLNEKWPFSVRRQRDFESESQSVTLGTPEGGVASSGSLCVSVLRWRWFQPGVLSLRTLRCFPSVSAAAKSLQCPKTNTGEKRCSTHGANRWLMCLGQQIHQIRNTKYKSTVAWRARGKNITSDKKKKFQREFKRFTRYRQFSSATGARIGGGQGVAPPHWIVIPQDESEDRTCRNVTEYFAQV